MKFFHTFPIKKRIKETHDTFFKKMTGRRIKVQQYASKLLSNEQHGQYLEKLAFQIVMKRYKGLDVDTSNTDKMTREMISYYIDISNMLLSKALQHSKNSNDGDECTTLHVSMIDFIDSIPIQCSKLLDNPHCPWDNVNTSMAKSLDTQELIKQEMDLLDKLDLGVVVKDMFNPNNIGTDGKELCRVCKRFTGYLIQKQDRSADEGMSTYLKCPCKAEYRI